MSDQPGLFESSPAPDVATQMARGASFSACRTYRFELIRIWDTTLDEVGFVMLNPSTADAETDDPTIRRCIAFARLWGYGGIVVRNLFALRATDPRELRNHPDPVGQSNDDQYLRHCRDDALTVAAWGVHGGLAGRDVEVRALLRRYGVALHHLGLTKDGFPKHPLARGKSYIPADTTPTRWEHR